MSSAAMKLPPGKNETEDDEMDQESPDTYKSDDEGSESQSGSDNEETSELDDDECERRKTMYYQEITELDKQFCNLKEILYKERMTQVDKKLAEVRAETAIEYTQPLQQLIESEKERQHVADVQYKLEVNNVTNRWMAEDQANEQDHKNEQVLLVDAMTQDLLDKVKRLEEDRNNIDLHSDLQNESQLRGMKRKRSGGPSGRSKKAVPVTGSYVIYQIKSDDIIEDWTAIKKAAKLTEKAEKKRKESLPKTGEKYPYSARFGEGKLIYEGEKYARGQHIIIDNQEDSPVHMQITAINASEVWVKRSDGSKSKLYIGMLQKGKYTIRHVPY